MAGDHTRNICILDTKAHVRLLSLNPGSQTFSSQQYSKSSLCNLAGSSGKTSIDPDMKIMVNMPTTPCIQSLLFVLQPYAINNDKTTKTYYKISEENLPPKREKTVLGKKALRGNRLSKMMSKEKNIL